MFRKVFYNAASQIVGKFVTASVTLVVTLLISKSLGPSGYGEFTKIFVFVAYFYTLSDFGLNSIFVKITGAKNQINNLRALVGLRLMISLVLVSVAVSLGFLLPYDSESTIGFSPIVKTGIAIASLTIITQSLFTTANAFFQKNLRYDLSTIAAAAGSSAIFITAAVASKFYSSITPFVFAYVIGGLVYSFVAFLIIYQRVHKIIFPKFQVATFKSLSKPAWPVGLALIFNLIYFRIDVFILANFRSTQEVGYYGLAYQFFEATLAIPIFFVNAIYPVLLQIYKKSQENFQKKLLVWLVVLGLISIIVMILLFIVSYLIPIVDQRFAQSQIALKILAVGIPFFFISALLWHLLIIYEKQKYLSYIYGFGALFNLALNLIFIPSFGYLAAAVITVVSEALILLLLVLVSVKIISNGSKSTQNH